jgi:hypothetical protein
MNFFILYFFNLFIILDSLPFDQLRKNKLYGLYGEDGDDHKVNHQLLDCYKAVLSNPGIIANMERVLDCLATSRYQEFIKKETIAPWQDGLFSEDWDFFGSRITQSQRVIFLGITLFIERNVTAQNELNRIQFARWMRVVRNIVENAGINSAEAMTGVMRLINELSKYSGDIYTFLAGNQDMKLNVAKEQIIEERKKAKLILADKRFECEIINAEKHRFFRGQIYFLLHISEDDIEQFVKYRDRAKAVFIKNIEEYPCRFHRALAALIYKYPIDGYNYYADEEDEWNDGRWYFFQDENAIRSVMLRHNDYNFFYKLIKLLLDKAASEAELDNIIRYISFDEKNWQTYLINSPHCFNYCQQKRIRWKTDDGIYLLKKSQMNGRHAELRTYYLYKERMKKDTFLPFNKCGYREPTNTHESPCAYLDGFTDHHGIDYELDILYSGSGYKLEFFSKKSGTEASRFLEEINNQAALGMEFKDKDHDRDQLSSSGHKTMEEVKERIMAICGSLKKLEQE